MWWLKLSTSTDAFSACGALDDLVPGAVLRHPIVFSTHFTIPSLASSELQQRQVGTEKFPELL